MCKSSEQTGQKDTPPALDSECKKLIADAPDGALLFSGDAKANRENVATEQAKKESIIGLVQFFQSEFIEGGQLDLFEHRERPGDQHETFRKDWAEISYEMIAEHHNQNTFTHSGDVTKDSSGYSANNILIVSQEWFKDHWEKSLTATDSTFYHRDIKSGKPYEDMMQLEVKKENPCKL